MNEIKVTPEVEQADDKARKAVYAAYYKKFIECTKDNNKEGKDK